VWCHEKHRRTGLGTQLLDRVVHDWCTRDLYLSVEPYTDEPLDAPTLAQWYSSFGFEDTPVPGVMCRAAQPYKRRT
jgi:GNAT superfamily N-acetyltransferase